MSVVIALTIVIVIGMCIFELVTHLMHPGRHM